MNERAQRAETAPKNSELVIALGFVALAGLVAGGSVDAFEHSPEVGAVIGVPALVFAAGVTAIAVSVWNRFTHKEKLG